MIKSIGPGAPNRIEPLQTRVAEQGAASVKASPVAGRPPVREAVPTLVSELVSDGPPVDLDKVSALRAAIAEGRYQVDPRTIAEKMIEQDLGPGAPA